MAQRIYVRLVEWLVILALAVMVAVTFISTAIRFLVPGMGGIFWAEEVTRYICIWMVFLASGLGVRYGVHLHVDLVTARLPDKVQLTLVVISCLLMVGFEVVLIWYGAIVAFSNMDQQSSSLLLPMGIFYAAIPVGGALMMFETLRVLIRAIRRLPGPGRDDGHELSRQLD